MRAARHMRAHGPDWLEDEQTLHNLKARLGEGGVEKSEIYHQVDVLTTADESLDIPQKAFLQRGQSEAPS